MTRMLNGLRMMAFVAGAISLALFVSVSNAETQAETAARMAKEAKEAADRSQAEHEKSEGKYDVKKSHDEHIPITEKAAGEAEQRKQQGK